MEPILKTSMQDANSLIWIRVTPPITFIFSTLMVCDVEYYISLQSLTEYFKFYFT